MHYQVISAERVRSDIRAIVEYWVEIDPDYAVRIHFELLEYLTALGDNPFVGDITRKSRYVTHRESYCQSYRVHFQVHENAGTVKVVRIRHVKRRSLKALE